MNAPVRRLDPDLPRRRFSVAEVVRMTELGLFLEDERLEIIDGEIIPMSPRGYRHEGLKGAINRLWGRLCPDGYDYVPETGLYLSDFVYLEPDFVVFESAVGLRNLRGPDVLLALEVADSSLRYDLRTKPGIYAEHGVRELWVVDVPERRTHVHRDPRSSGYASVETVPAQDRLTPCHAPAEFGFVLDQFGLR